MPNRKAGRDGTHTPAKPLFLTFDLEEFDLPLDLCGIPMDEGEMYEIAYDGMKKASVMLDRTGVKTTFFTTATFGRKYPEVIRRLQDGGHEIAFHGYQHNHKYSKMRQADAYRFIGAGKRVLEKITGKHIVGFRSPWLFTPSPAMLKKLGFEYDSSMHPTWVPGHYFNFREPRSMSRSAGLRILPISVTPAARLPFSWIWFRNFGLEYAKLCTRMCVLDQPYVNIYLHPWEFIDVSKRAGMEELPLIIKRNTGRRMERMVEDYVVWCRRIGLEPMPIEKWLSCRN